MGIDFTPIFFGFFLASITSLVFVLLPWACFQLYYNLRAGNHKNVSFKQILNYMKNKYPALKTIVYFLYVIAILIGALTIYIAIQPSKLIEIPALNQFSNYLILLSILILFFGGIMVLVIIARAEVIRVYIDIANGTNETNRILEAQNSKTKIEGNI